MAYSKQNFSDGNILYASQLNSMDDQIASNEARIAALETDNGSFSEQGAGTIIATIHGHEHSDVYDNTHGWNNIGTVHGASTLSNVGTSNEYGIDIFTIDTVNNILYETRIGRGSSRKYSFGTTNAQITE